MSLNQQVPHNLKINVDKIDKIDTHQHHTQLTTPATDILWHKCNFELSQLCQTGTISTQQVKNQSDTMFMQHRLTAVTSNNHFRNICQVWIMDLPQFISDCKSEWIVKIQLYWAKLS